MEKAFLLLLSIYISILIDLVVGEPPKRIHPVVWIGKLISWMDLKLRRGRHLRMRGAILVITVSSSVLCITWTFVHFMHLVFGDIGFLFGTILVMKPSFAFRSMDEHVKPIARYCSKSDYTTAKKYLARVVRRDVDPLTDEQVISAAVETVAEGSVDGFTSPLFYFSLLGAPGAMMYRAVNTLDSMIGYRDERYREFGWFAAKSDTILNYIPARLTALVMAFSFAIFRMNWARSLKTAIKHHRKTDSINAGWPMSAIAGGLGVRLEKPGYYILGNKLEDLKPTHIYLSLRIFKLTCTLFILLICIPIILSRAVIGVGI